MLLALSFFFFNLKVVEKPIETFNKKSLIAKKYDNMNEKIHNVGLSFIGIPYLMSTDTTIRFDSLDCYSFIQTITAIALNSKIENSNYNSFKKILRLTQYRDENITKFSSKYHYFTEWKMNLIARHWGSDFSEYYGGIKTTKKINFLSKIKKKSDQELINNENNIENFYYIPTNKMPFDKLVDGDIVAIVSAKKNLDVEHVGIIHKKDNIVHLLHCSSSKGVIISETPLEDYVNNLGALGIVFFRIEKNN